ncbi:hypothetical protein NMY22_g12138 [Coprinellus aureogranulatus]|nr:hypothetical protein NMY22_g12138 [Coprinellus aureogranulatus]
MDDSECIGSTTSIFMEALSVAQSWYLARHRGGSPSTHSAAVHQAKFITRQNGVEDIYIHNLGPDDLPLSDVEEHLGKLNSRRISSLGAERLPFYDRYKREVEEFRDKYTNLKEELAALEDPDPVPALETNLSSFLESLIKPLRALLLLLLAVNSSDDTLDQISLKVLLTIPERGGGGDSPDLTYQARSTDKGPAFSVELKIPERLLAGTFWLYLMHDYLTQNPHFSMRDEHNKKYTFSPTEEVTVSLPSKGCKSDGAKHVPSKGVPIPSRGINKDSLYKLAIQAMSYTVDSTLRACLLTNVMYTHVLFRHAKSGVAHHFQVYHLSHSRPPNGVDLVKFFNFYLYICDQFMMPRSTFTPPPDVPTVIPRPPLPNMPQSPEGRQGLAMPAWVSLNFNPFSSVMDSLKTLIMQPLFTHMLHKVQPRFIMDSVQGRIVLKYATLRSMLSHLLPSITLTFKDHSREAAILEDEDGLFVVKVHGDEGRFATEVKALAVLSDIDGVPKLLGTGSTVAGNKFVVMSKVGNALTEEVTDDEAQQVWDTVLKHVHQRGIHHHDLLYHNITRTSNGSLCIIDFGESAAACPEMQPCADRDWLLEHNVVQ